MRYYTIENNGILIAENKHALARFYNNVKELPADYVEGKYIAVSNELVVNPEYEAEQEKLRKEAEIAEIKSRLEDLDVKSIRAIRAVIAGTSTDEDVQHLADLENQAKEIRVKITINESEE